MQNRDFIEDLRVRRIVRTGGTIVMSVIVADFFFEEGAINDWH